MSKTVAFLYVSAWTVGVWIVGGASASLFAGWFNGCV